jgi:division protein CdvB (Snf7/Vps24/ESCRT-III family)
VEQLELLIQIRDAFNEMDRALETVRSVREQLDEVSARFVEEEVKTGAQKIDDELTSIENELTQTKPGGWSQKPKIRRHLSWVASAASSQRGEYTDARPTDQLQERFQDLRKDLDGELSRLQKVLELDLVSFNGMLRDKQASAIILKP